MRNINTLSLLLILAGYFVIKAEQSAYGDNAEEGWVSCGCHDAPSCPQCGPKPSMCHGDCTWTSSGCVRKYGMNGCPGDCPGRCPGNVPHCQEINSNCTIKWNTTGICCELPPMKMHLPEMCCLPLPYCPNITGTPLGIGNSWKKIINDGYVRSIAIKDDYIYGSGLYNHVWKQPLSGNEDWVEEITVGAHTDIAISGNYIYGIGLTNEFWKYSLGVSGATWVSTGIDNTEAIQSIAIDEAGTKMYGAGLGGFVYSHTLNPAEPPGWTQVTSIVDEQVIDIAIQGNYIYGVGLSNKVWKNNLNAITNWEEIITDGAVTSIALKDDNNIYGVGIFGKVWRYTLSSTG